MTAIDAKPVKFGIMLGMVPVGMNSWRAPFRPGRCQRQSRFLYRDRPQGRSSGHHLRLRGRRALYQREVDPALPQPLRAADRSSRRSASATTKIGLAGTVSTSYSDPFTRRAAVRLARPDLGGRAGWNVVTTPLEGFGEELQPPQHPEHALRYEIADEYLEVTQGLWDSAGTRVPSCATVRMAASSMPPKLHRPRPQGPLLPGGRSAQYRPLEAGPAGDLPGWLVRCRHQARR